MQSRQTSTGLRGPGVLACSHWLPVLALCILSVGLRAAAQDCDLAPAGLVGWWPGEGSTEDLVGTNGASLKGGATPNAPGYVGSAFSFDGTNGFVQIPDSPSLKPTNLTIEAWVRFNSLDSFGNATAGQQYLVFKQNSRNTDFEGFELSK